MGTTNYYYTRDHLGSVRELTDSAGAVVARYDYDLYGRRTKVLGTTTDADFGFTGHYHHKPSGLTLALYRIYSADFARWISRDPIAERGGVNLYDYVGNNPVNFVDPLGLIFGAVPILGTIEQGWNTWQNNVNGMKATDYTANTALGKEACELDIDNQAFWKAANYLTPNAVRAGIEVAATLITTYAATPVAGGVVGGVSTLDTLAGIAIAQSGSEKIKKAAQEAKAKCCKE